MPSALRSGGPAWRGALILALFVGGVGLLFPLSSPRPGYLDESGPYQCQATGFGLNLPPKWALVRLPGSHAVGVFARSELAAANETAVVPSIVISHGPVQNSPTLSSWFADAITDSRQCDPMLRIISRGSKIVGGVPCFTFEFETQVECVRVRGEEVHFLLGNQAFQIRYAAPLHSYEAYRNDFESTLESVRLPELQTPADEDESVI